MPKPITIDLPDEFVELCERYGKSPIAVLRQFIADAAGIIDNCDNPRGDGYSSAGSDERALAQEYIERAYGTGD